MSPEELKNALQSELDAQGPNRPLPAPSSPSPPPTTRTTSLVPLSTALDDYGRIRLVNYLRSKVRWAALMTARLSWPP